MTPGSAITDIAGLKRASVGVVGGDINRNLVGVLTKEYDLSRANVSFRNLAPADTRRALDAKEVRAILVVVPLAEKYLTLLRGLFPRGEVAILRWIPVMIRRIMIAGLVSCASRGRPVLILRVVEAELDALLMRFCGEFL